MAVERVATLSRVVEHAPDTRSLFLRLPAGERLEFRPGQFISCLLPVGGERLIRPYSLASSPEDDELEICLNLVPGGPGSHHLFELSAGTTVRFTGPWGTFVLDAAPDAEAVFVAEGTGIAPIRPMLRRALAAGGGRPLHLLHGTGEPSLFRIELDRLARTHDRFRFAAVAATVLRDEVVRRWIDDDDDRSRRFFVCGVGSIVHTLRDLLRGAGYERRAVQYEQW